MYDKALVLEVLMQIHEAAETILQRFQPISTVSDYTDTAEGREKLDAVCMLLIAIGESLKKVDKITNNSLLVNYPQIEWKKVKGMRDIISHQYFDVNAEAIYDVCDTKIEPLIQAVRSIIEDLKSY